VEIFESTDSRQADARAAEREAIRMEETTPECFGRSAQLRSRERRTTHAAMDDYAISSGRHSASRLAADFAKRVHDRPLLLGRAQGDRPCLREGYLRGGLSPGKKPQTG
jgi:hypothetical protein